MPEKSAKSKPGVTLEMLREHVDELDAEFGSDAQVAFPCVSRTQLSVARYYGGCEVNGKRFIYNPSDDSLIREDVVKWMAKKLKERTDVEAGSAVDVGGDLLSGL